MGVLLVASIVLLSFSVQVGRDNSLWLSRDETRWLLALQLILITLAIHISNIWIAIAICWIAIHPFITHIGYSCGPLQFAPDRNSVYTPLYPVLWWVILYTLLSHYQWSWRIVAWTLLLWALINIFISLYQQHYHLPHWFKDDRTPQYPISPGLLGGSFMLSFIAAVGSLSTAFIIYIDHYYYLIPILLILIASSLMTGTLSPILSVTIPSLLFLTTIHPYYFILLCCSISLGMVIIYSPTHSSSFSSRLTSWKVAAKLSVSTRFIGIGLGSWNAVTNPVDNNDSEGTLWRNLHNDWLQSIVELSPIPAICAIILLVTSWMTVLASSTTTISPGQLYGLLLTTSIAIYAIVYFPMRDHTPSVLLAASLALMGK